MRLTADKIELLLNKYPAEFQLTYLKSISHGGIICKSGDEVRLDDIQRLIEAECHEIDVIFTPTLYDYLTMEFPLEYRKPYGVMNFIEVDRHLETLKVANSLSKRKRFLYLIGDVYGTDSRTAQRIAIINHHEEMDYEKWNQIKRFINKDHKFFYRNSENGIILFVDLRDSAADNYVERFKKNTDLITAMVSRRKNASITIAPDFITTEDVISVTDPENLLDEYVKNDSRLIIIGEKLTEIYKGALNVIIKYDRYARLMVVPAIDPNNIDHFLYQAKLVYNSDRWS